MEPRKIRTEHIRLRTINAPALCCRALLAAPPGHPVPFEQGGKWGYKDAAGRIVIQPRFERADASSSHGLASAVDGQG